MSNVISFATGCLWIALLCCIPVFGWIAALAYAGHWISGGFNE
jgi:hypothetical protein